MLVVRIELWPKGDESKKMVLGIGTIANDGQLSFSKDDPKGELGNYNVVLHKAEAYAAKPGIWKKGKILGFPRLTLGPWDLLFRALEVTVGYRNRKRTK